MMIGADARLAALRAWMAARGLDGVLVPRADRHLAEYVPAAEERLAWLTGFTGSAGLAIVLPDRAAVFTDGRYTLQLASQTDAALWERRHLIEDRPQNWLAAHAPGGRIGFDPWTIAEEGLARYREAGLAMVPLEANPVDAIWSDRPAAPAAPARPHPEAFAGESSALKRARLAAELAREGQDAAVLSDPASIAWLLNLRGEDVPFTPFARGFALLHADASVELFIAPEKIPPELAVALGNAVSLAPEAALPAALASLAGKRVRLDRAASPAWFAIALRASGAVLVDGADPCVLPKACKNAVEREGARAAQARDAIALCRFLHWLDGASAETEMSAAARLLAFRAELPHFRGESFPAISGAGEHGAIIHYRVDAASDRALRPRELYLIDSGAQYEDGTTDVTRTVWTGGGDPPAAFREHYTRVLAGHVALAALVFPQGVCGAHLDGFARAALWQAGLDYDHGTGHGVGSYLSVHEGPVSLSRAARPVPLEPGMILSDEPGLYVPGSHGLRIENLLLVEPAGFAHATKPFLRFETLTLAPYDRRLIDRALLGAAACRWVDAYHARVADCVAPMLPAEAAAWLRQACRPLAGD